ncbi:UDP-3-O-[3-hydroxymyristoyl] glucosamine N-acyltransferase [Granulibacter bethesdensis CGDNIH4]|nr:UDP-3-O-[3-hydroxymyristoyl] glucosamine N-acyltransferase [Granulibacter bethesdensis CGDNIH4]
MQLIRLSRRSRPIRLRLRQHSPQPSLRQRSKHIMSVQEVVGDPRFFARSGPYDVAAVAEAVGASIPADCTLSLTGVAPLQIAGPSEVSFLDNRRYADALEQTRAGAVIIKADMVDRVPAGVIALVVPEPYLAWARVAALFYPLPPVQPGIHPSAVVDETACIDPSAQIGPLAVIEAGVEIGPDCRIAAHAVIGAGVKMGRSCRIGSHASLSHAILGDRVYVYPGVRIGQDGFGFAPSPEGFVTVPQLGRVVLENDVEVGANSTIDRGSMHDTVIGAGSRLDNLVMIAHNVQMGRACVIVSQVGISGSTTLGDHVVLAGQAGLIGHLKIGSGARIGAQAGVMADVPAGAEIVGSPAQPAKDFFRQIAMLRRLARR